MNTRLIQMKLQNLKLKNKRKAEDDIIDITENDDNVCLPEGGYYKLKQFFFLIFFLF
jgi:hypothetical protein